MAEKEQFTLEVDLKKFIGEFESFKKTGKKSSYLESLEGSLLCQAVVGALDLEIMLGDYSINNGKVYCTYYVEYGENGNWIVTDDIPNVELVADKEKLRASMFKELYKIAKKKGYSTDRTKNIEA